MQTLNWKQEKATELAGDWVQVETRAVDLNFKDVLNAMGIVEVHGRGLGCKLSGIVTKIGPDVKHLKQGDRVFCCADGSFSTSLSMSELCCAKMPESLSFVEAATISLTYSTVIYGLMDIAHLSKNQTVLIHSAADGIGICALQIARMIGAEIFARWVIKRKSTLSCKPSTFREITSSTRETFYSCQILFEKPIIEESTWS